MRLEDTAVVIASSRCCTAVPSKKPPRIPSRPVHDVSSESAGGTSTAQLSGIQYSEIAQDKSVDDSFFAQHLNGCSHHTLSKVKKFPRVQQHLDTIMSTDGQEEELYYPITELLTTISETVYDALPSAVKKSLPCNAAIVFLDHHTSAPTHFPIRDVDDKPDTIGAFDLTNGFETDTKGICKGLPFHRIETIVEAKAIYGEDGKAQAARYAFQVQKARPDRPGFYCLSVKPQHFQIVYSSPVGLRISDHTPWENLDTLCSHVHSLYVPPDGHFHFLYDRTITWKETPNNPLTAPKWTVKTESATYTDTELIFLGNPWGRRTTILRAEVPGQTPVIIKEYYLDDDRRYEEGELLGHAHAEGYIPGFVRSVWAEDVMSDGRKVMVKDGSNMRRKRRITLADSGAKLEWAASVNDILMAVYDALEVHRTLVRKRAILHRDMSSYNILMYPELSSWPGCRLRDITRKTPRSLRTSWQGRPRTLMSGKLTAS
ncbi:hypothetical protein BD413DRAFT_34275 [Trametes elegans]|nr:hypothetical protein BD413DRAFT_34275 [Trametes elegans]